MSSFARHCQSLTGRIASAALAAVRAVALPLPAAVPHAVTVMGPSRAASLCGARAVVANSACTDAATSSAAPAPFPMPALPSPATAPGAATPLATAEAPLPARFAVQSASSTLTPSVGPIAGLSTLRSVPLASAASSRASVPAPARHPRRGFAALRARARTSAPASASVLASAPAVPASTPAARRQYSSGPLYPTAAAAAAATAASASACDPANASQGFWSLPDPLPLDHPYTAAPRSVLIVKKWGSRSANRYARDIAESLAHRGVQVFIEPTTVHDYGDAVYPTVLDLLARTDPAAEELFRQNFAPVVSEAFTFPPQPSPLAAASAVVADSAAGSSPQYQQPLLSSMESWRSFTRSPSTAAALGNLDPRECIALARKLDSWQRHIDLVVSVGGDGTLLHVSTLFPHRVPPTLAFGCGSFGFLMPFNPDTAPQALDALLQGRLRVFNRTRLAFKVGGVAGYDTRGAPVVPPFAPTDPHCFHLLNEVVLKHSYGLNVGTGVSEIECRIDGDVLARFQGDGLMIASPTGSTAYSMAAGGSIVHPALQSLLISPICPMTLSSRPLVLPGQATISLTPIHDSVLLEGKFGRVIQPLEVVTVRQSQFPVPVFARANVTTDFVADLGSRMNYARMVRVRREEPFAPSAYGAAPSSAVPAASAAAAAAAAGAAAAAAAPFAPSSAFAPSASAFAAFPGAPYAPLPTPAPAPAAPAVPQTPVHAAFAPVFPRTLAAAAAASAAPGSEAAPVALAPATSAPSAESCGDVCDPAAPPSVAAAAAATAGVDAGVGAAAPAPRSSGTGAPSANSLGPIGSFMSKRAQEDVTQDRDDARSGQRNR